MDRRVGIRIDADTKAAQAAVARLNTQIRNLSKLKIAQINTDNISRAAQQTQRLGTNLQRVGERARSSTSSLERMGRTVNTVFNVAVVVGFANAITRAADNITNMENQLKSAGIQAQNLGNAVGFVVRTANDTRVSFNSAATLLARMTRSTNQLGFSQQKVRIATTAVLQGFQLAGASVEEAKNSVIQLSQGLSSGALRGDELRSVLEGAPVIASAIAKELGVGVGQLRDMGAAGKITSDVVMRALLNDADDLQDKFSRLNPTFAGAFTVFKNGLSLAVGQTTDILGDALGIKTAFIDAGKAISEAFLSGDIRRTVSFLIADIRTRFAELQVFVLGLFDDFDLEIPSLGNLLAALGALIANRRLFGKNAGRTNFAQNLNTDINSVRDNLARGVGTLPVVSQQQQRSPQPHTDTADIKTLRGDFDGFNKTATRTGFLLRNIASGISRVGKNAATAVEGGGVRALNTQLGDYDTRLRSLTASQQGFSTSLADNRTALADAEKGWTSLTTQMDAVDKKMRRLENKNQMGSDAYKNLTTQLRDLGTQAGEFRTAINTLNTEQATLTKNLSDADASLAKHAGNLDKATVASNRFSGFTAMLSGALGRLGNKIGAVDVGALNTQLTALNETHKTYTASVVANQTELDKATASWTALTTEMDAIDKKMRRLESANKTGTTAYTSLQQSITDTSTEAGKFYTEMNRLKTVGAELKTNLAGVSGEINRVGTAFKEASGNALGTNFGDTDYSETTRQLDAARVSWANLAGEMDEIDKKMRRLERANKTGTEGYQRLTQTLTETSTEAGKFATEIRRLEGQQGSLRASLAGIDTDIAKVGDGLSKAANLDGLVKTLGALEETQARYRVQLSDTNTALADAQSKWGSLVGEMDKIDEKMRRLEATNKTGTAAYTKLVSKITEVSTEAGKFATTINELKATQATLTASLADTDAGLERTRSGLTRTVGVAQFMTRVSGGLATGIDGISRSFDGVGKAVDGAVGHLRNFKTEYDKTADVRNARLQGGIAAVGNAQQNITGQITGMLTTTLVLSEFFVWEDEGGKFENNTVEALNQSIKNALENLGIDDATQLEMGGKFGTILVGAISTFIVSSTAAGLLQIAVVGLFKNALKLAMIPITYLFQNFLKGVLAKVSPLAAIVVAVSFISGDNDFAEWVRDTINSAILQTLRKFGIDVGMTNKEIAENPVMAAQVAVSNPERIDFRRLNEARDEATKQGDTAALAAIEQIMRDTKQSNDESIVELNENNNILGKNNGAINRLTKMSGQLEVALRDNGKKYDAFLTTYDDTNNNNGGQFASRGTPQAAGAFNGGGRVRGAGTATSDSIPAMLSNGEFVIKASSVNKFGAGFFERLNAGLVPQFFNKGGEARLRENIGATQGRIAAETLDVSRYRSLIDGGEDEYLPLLRASEKNLSQYKRDLRAYRSQLTKLEDGGSGSGAGAGSGSGGDNPSGATEGENYGNQFRNDFNRGLKQALRDGDLRAFGETLLDSFTGGVVDSFADGLTTRIFDGALGEDGERTGGVGGIFDNIFGEQNELGESIAGSISGVFGGFTETLGGLFSGFTGGFGEVLGGLGNSLSGLMGNLGGLLGGGGASAGGGMGGLLSLGMSFLGLNSGGIVPSISGSQAGVDSVPAMLTPGELVVPANQVRDFQNNNTNKSEQHFNISITGDVSRQTRKEMVKMMPQIASGVNAQNKERGVR